MMPCQGWQPSEMYRYGPEPLVSRLLHADDVGNCQFKRTPSFSNEIAFFVADGASINRVRFYARMSQPPLYDV